MRKFKIVYMSIIMLAVLCFFVFEVFSATYMSLKFAGQVRYYVSDIGARIWSNYSITDADSNKTYNNLTLTSEDIKETDTKSNITGNIYYLQNSNMELSSADMNIGVQQLEVGSTLTLYIFMRNVGPRNILPTQANYSNSEYVTVTEQDLLFDVSKIDNAYDPYNIKQNAVSLSSYLEQIETIIPTHATEFNSGSDTIGVNDVFLKKISFYSETADAFSEINLSFGFMAEISHFSQNILTVYQDLNITDSEWKKYGYNALLDSGATKIESNSLSALATSVRNADALGNADISNLGLAESSLGEYYNSDDYYNAVVYKDIDLVNIDIATGEPIGRLSDLNYNFEWYGGTVTLPSGTTLASGRELEYGDQGETIQYTFTVDVYTYYPTMYIRRWVNEGKQYISISDQTFVGAVEVKSYYVATFESTIFNANGDVATNSNNAIIPRSYIFNYTPLTYGSASFVHTNYFPSSTTVSGYTEIPTQAQMLSWAKNLTSDWQASGLTSKSGYLPNARIAQGENYVAFVFNYLYLVKYADNNAQSMVGYGNIDTHSKYKNDTNVSTTPAGVQIKTSLNSNSYYEAQKGGGTIGCFGGPNEDYTHNTTCEMSYGYDFTSYTDTISNNSNGKQGLYATQYLTYNTGSKRVLLDGYVGSNNFTSVFCLGQCNPWGNVYTWIFGNAVEGTSVTNENGETTYSIWLNTTFEDYNGSNWYTSYEKSSVEILTTGNYNYSKMTYSLPTASGYYNHLGVSGLTSNPMQMLVGVTTSESTKGGYGLKDYYYVSVDTPSYCNNFYGLLRGGDAGNNDIYAGAFYYNILNKLSNSTVSIGFRLSLPC